ncbi:MAG: ABC transporter permease, partial [Ignavibacteria bacterium]
MISNYIKTAFRNFFKYKTYTLINIFGVAIGTAAFILIMQYVGFERSYDKFQEDSDLIYRLRYERESEDGETVRFASCCPPAALRIRDQFTEVEKIARLFRYSAVISTGENKFLEERIFFAEPDFLDILKFEFLKGDPLNGIRKPNNAFISQSTAIKYFGTADCIGRNFIFNGKTSYQVTGIFKDIPYNSHVKFDFLLCYKNILDIYGQDIEDSWGDTGAFTYLKVKRGADIQKLEESFVQIAEAEFGEVLDYYKIKMHLPMQPLEDIHLESHFQQEYEVNGDKAAVNVLFIIAFFIIIMAWINYCNLSTARSLNRAKEIGLRKVVGASRSQLSVQLFIETVMLNVFAVVLALGIVEISSSFISDLTGIPLEFSMWDQTWLLVILPLIVIAGILLTGFYPVFVISSFRPVEIVKGRFASSRSGLILRKILVVFQFALALLLIVGTLTVSKQVSFMKKQELGFSVDQMLILNLPRVKDDNFNSKLETFKQELELLNSIREVCVTTEVPGRQIYWDAGGIYKEGQDSDSKNYQIVGIDYDFMDMFNCEILYGRNFSREFTDESKSLILNETAADWLGFENSKTAVGGKVVYWGEVFTVIGVVKDYHQQSPKQAFEPHIFRFMPAGRGRLGVIAMNMNQAEIQNTISLVKEKWDEFFPGNPFDFFFLDEYYNQQYKSDELFGKV